MSWMWGALVLLAACAGANVPSSMYFTPGPNMVQLNAPGVDLRGILCTYAGLIGDAPVVRCYPDSRGANDTLLTRATLRCPPPPARMNATTCAVYYEVVSMARGRESDTAEIYVIPYPSFNYPWKDRLERSVNDITMEYSEWIIICVLVIFLSCLGWEAWIKHKDAQKGARAAFPFLWTGPYPTKKRALKKWAKVMDNHRSTKMPNWANVKNAANQRFKELYGHGVME